MLLAASHPDKVGPIAINGAPMAYWAGTTGKNPMRYTGGRVGGVWPAMLMADLGNGVFDGSLLVQNFETLNPANTYWKKLYGLYSKVDTEAERFLEFERWWGGFFMMNEEEIRWIIENLFVGNRLAHGQAYFGDGRIDLKNIRAPLHQPHNLSGIQAAQVAFLGVPQVACFDTAFHRAHPFVNDAFALPRSLYDEGVRRYGFHGLSYEYVTGRLAEIAPFHAKGRVIVCHLGSGASMRAIRNGYSIASTMGFSALDGLPTGTRPSQIDPGVLLYLMDQKGMDAKAISDLLYKSSGLNGLSGISNDMHDLEASDDPRAKQAIDYFVFRLRREIGAMAAVLGGLDAIVFCGGIGENSRLIRESALEAMEWIGIELDLDRNRGGADVISSDRSRVRAFIIRTNEELMIARHTQQLLTPQASIHLVNAQA